MKKQKLTGEAGSTSLEEKQIVGKNTKLAEEKLKVKKKKFKKMSEELDIYNIEESKYASEKNLFSTKKSEATEFMKKEKQKQMIENSKRRYAEAEARIEAGK